MKWWSNIARSVVIMSANPSNPAHQQNVVSKVTARKTAGHCTAKLIALENNSNQSYRQAPCRRLLQHCAPAGMPQNASRSRQIVVAALQAVKQHRSAKNLKKHGKRR